MRQIVALKKENARLHKDVEKGALSSLKTALNTSPGPQPALAGAAQEAGPGESIAKFVPWPLFYYFITARAFKIILLNQIQGRGAAAAAAAGC